MTDNTTTFSFELFPPKTEQGIAKLHQTVATLNARKPEFFSVTYGAGGSTQSNTFATVDWVRDQGISIAPHLSCIGSSRDEILRILQRYQSQGIDRNVALRGDQRARSRRELVPDPIQRVIGAARTVVEENEIPRPDAFSQGAGVLDRRMPEEVGDLPFGVEELGVMDQQVGAGGEAPPTSGTK